MNENSNSPSVKKKPSVTVKNVLRTLTFCCAILFFCPMFMVSCSDSDWGVDTDLMKVSAITAIKGISGMGETLVQPHPILVLCLLLPVAAIILLFIKKFTDKQIATSVCGATAVDLIIWIIFRTTAKKLAEDSQCQFETTGWYVLNIIVMLLILVLTVAVLINQLQLHTDLMTAFSKKDINNAVGQMSDTVGHFSEKMTHVAGNVADNIRKKTNKEDIIGYCAKCGKPITYGHKFCFSCGTAVPESMIAEAEAARKAEEAARKAEEEARKAEEEKKKAEEEARKAEEKRNAAEAAEKEKKVTEAVKPEETGRNTEEKTSEPTVNSTKCPNCGQEIDADAKFCKFCGCKLK